MSKIDRDHSHGAPSRVHRMLRRQRSKIHQPDGHNHCASCPPRQGVHPTQLARPTSQKITDRSLAISRVTPFKLQSSTNAADGARLWLAMGDHGGAAPLRGGCPWDSSRDLVTAPRATTATVATGGKAVSADDTVGKRADLPARIGIKRGCVPLW